MAKYVFVDKDGKAVAEGSPESAFQFKEGDERLDKFRKAAAARNALASGKAPAEPDDNDGSVERVAKPGNK